MDYYAEARSVLDEALLFAEKNPIDTANFKTFSIGKSYFMYDETDAIIDKNLAGLFNSLGDLYDKTGEWDKSVAACKKAIVLYEAAPTIHYSSKAAESARRLIIQFAYSDAIFCYSLLQSVLYQQGKYDEALALLDDLEKNKIPIYKASIAKLDIASIRLSLEKIVNDSAIAGKKIRNRNIGDVSNPCFARLNSPRVSSK